jgi:hypothetical protein
MKPGTRHLGRVNPRAGFNNYGFLIYIFMWKYIKNYFFYIKTI